MELISSFLVCGLVRLRISRLISEVIEGEQSGEVIDVIISHSFPSKLVLSLETLINRFLELILTLGLICLSSLL